MARIYMAIIVLLASANYSYSQTSRYHIDSFDIYKSGPPGGAYQFTVLNNKLYFFSTWYPSETGVMYEIINGGPVLVPDPNNTAGYAVGGGHLRATAVVNGTMYYSGYRDDTGYELFAYDGSGPADLAVELTPGKDYLPKGDLTVLNNKIYFTTYEKSTGKGNIGVYDPAANTASILYNRYTEDFEKQPTSLTLYNNKLYFPAHTAQLGTELFQYDPATDKIIPVTDINAGSSSSFPSGLIVYNNILYFAALDSVAGKELWQYDGVAPARLTDIRPGKEDGIGIPLSPLFTDTRNVLYGYKGDIYFCGITPSGAGALYKYDITQQKASFIQQMNHKQFGNSRCNNFIEYGDKLFFAADDTFGNALWEYDGMNPAKLVTIKNKIRVSRPANMFVHNNRLFMQSWNKDINDELFIFTDSSVSISTINNSLAAATAYPNPVSNTLHIDMSLKQPETLAVTLTDMQGRTVYSAPQKLYSQGKHVIEVPVINLPPGLYMYRLTDKNNRLLATEKVLRL